MFQRSRYNRATFLASAAFFGQVGNGENFAIPATGFFLEFDTDTPEGIFLACFIPNQDGLLIYGSGFYFADIFFLSNQLEWVFFVFPDDEIDAPVLDATSEKENAKIAISNPDIFWPNGSQHRFQHGVLLGMTVLASKHIDRQPKRQTIHHQRFSRKRRNPFAQKLLDNRFYLSGGVSYQACRCFRFYAVQFIVDRYDRMPISSFEA